MLCGGVPARAVPGGTVGKLHCGQRSALSLPVASVRCIIAKKLSELISRRRNVDNRRLAFCPKNRQGKSFILSPSAKKLKGSDDAHESF
jgi:hypothetical protein